MPGQKDPDEVFDGSGRQDDPCTKQRFLKWDAVQLNPKKPLITSMKSAPSTNPIDFECRSSILSRHGIRPKEFMLLDLMQKGDVQGVNVMCCTMGEDWTLFVKALIARGYLKCNNHENLSLGANSTGLLAALSNPIYKN
jgi:hypothetical protein